MSDKAYVISQGFFLVALVAVATSAAGCDLIEGVFKVGMWAGIVMVVIVVAAMAMIARSLRNRRGGGMEE
jgi:hypothetical protein